jgi:dihydrolipoamide dehydrogenase
MPRLLAEEEPEASTVVGQALEASGVRLILGRKVVRVDTGPVAVLDEGTTVTGSHLLLAVGRTPQTSDLGLDTVGVELGRPRASTT